MYSPFLEKQMRSMGLTRALGTAVLLLWALAAPAGAQEAMESPDGGMAAPPPPAAPLLRVETPYGPVTIKTYPDDAPKTVARITELAREGFYDGLTFHRVVAGFVVQGGDPTGTGRGGSGQTLPPEFNDHKHVLGTVAMARAQDPNSADSQFYISLDRNPHLDGKYTVFGQVVDGIDAVLQIRQGDPMLRVEVLP
jgi:cyclophilin family peptidyl-prolyl cis-trans isomerase